MSISKQLGIVFVAGVIGFFGLQLGKQFSNSDGLSLISKAEARVGRPLTPVSVAGVGRRTARRCANGTYNC